jgi:hypothetical protein
MEAHWHPIRKGPVVYLAVHSNVRCQLYPTRSCRGGPLDISSYAKVSKLHLSSLIGQPVQCRRPVLTAMAGEELAP